MDPGSTGRAVGRDGGESQIHALVPHIPSTLASPHRHSYFTRPDPYPVLPLSFLSTRPLPFSQVNITVFHFGLPDKVWNKQRSPSPTRPRPESQTWARSGLPVVPGEDEQTAVWRHQHEQAQAQRVYDPTTGD